MISPIRCLNTHPHGIYDACGALIGGISDNAAYFHCTHCKESNWYKVYHDESGGIIVEHLPNNTRIKFEEQLKLVE